MIVNARMYGVSPAVTGLWRSLFSSVVAAADLQVEWFEHAPPAPLEELWSRSDLAAVFMCGLPFARAKPRPILIAAPVPSPAAFGGQPSYWSEFVVRRDSDFGSVEKTFGRRIALTVPGSQSGCVAALSYFQSHHPRDAGQAPLYAEIIAPTITPLGALAAVIQGDAEIAPIDAYALRLLEAHRPAMTAQVRVVGRTVPTPIPPLVASSGLAQDGAAAALSSAFGAAHADPDLKFVLEQLLLGRFIRPEPASYDLLQRRFETTLRFWRSRPLAARIHPAFAW